MPLRQPGDPGRYPRPLTVRCLGKACTAGVQAPLPLMTVVPCRRTVLVQIRTSSTS